MQRFFDLATELNLSVLFEAHTKEEIEAAPKAVRIFGINSRKFMASKRWVLAKVLTRMWRSGAGPDPSVELQTFSLIEHRPSNAIKVAESGVRPGKVSQIKEKGYNAVLVGTSLLKDPAGIEHALCEFESALISDSHEVTVSAIPVAA